MSDAFLSIMNWIESTLGLSASTQGKVLASLIIILVLVLVGRTVRGVVRRNTDDVRVRYQASKTTSYILVPIGIVLVGRVWFAGFGSIATFLGLASAGVAIALKDLLVNLAGWGFILWRRPFVVGDRIEVAGSRGDVIDIRIFQFSLLEIGNWVSGDQSTGRVIHVPNGTLFTAPLANYTKGFEYIFDELQVLVTFESDWRRAKAILTEIIGGHGSHFGQDAQQQIRRHSSQYLIYYQNLDPIVYTSVVDSGVLLTLRYLTEPRQRRGNAEKLWEAILEQFGKDDTIDFAYPTTRFYHNRAEGKPGTGGGERGAD